MAFWTHRSIPRLLPDGITCTSWLGKIHNLFEGYGIPGTQQAPLAIRYMREDRKKAADIAGCYSITWDEFTV